MPAKCREIGVPKAKLTLKVWVPKSPVTDGRCAHYTLVDADGNGVPSAGDSVKVDYNKCTVYYLDEEFSGTLNIRLTSVDNAAKGVLSGTVDFGAGLVPVQIASNTWLGSLNFRRSSDLTKEQLEVSASAADDLRSTSREDGTNFLKQESYQHPQFIRTLRRDTARTSLTGSMSLASDRLGGRVDITIDPQLSGYLRTHFDSGSVRFTGAANTRITLPASAIGAETLLAELDSNGDGTADGTLALKWNTDLAGYLLDDFANGVISARDDSRLQLVFQPPYDGVDVDGALRFQFDRPLRPDTVLQVQLLDHGSPNLDGSQGSTGYSLAEITNDWPVIAADVELHGALVLVRPRETLQYGHSYQVLMSNDNFGSSPFVLHAADSTAQISLNTQLTSFATDATLGVTASGAGYRSMAMPGNSITVSAAVPNALSLPLRYQWSQLSGPTLELGSPTQASTNVRLAGAVATGFTKAVLQLVVIDSIGRRSVKPVDVQVANLSGLTSVLYFSGGADSSNGGETRAYSAQTGAFAVYTTSGYLYARYDDFGPRRTLWTFLASDANGGFPAPGTYSNAVAFTSSTPNAPHMTFACNGVGSFTVLEREIADDGTVTRLAVDFEERCPINTRNGPLHGSWRFNSSLPIQP